MSFSFTGPPSAVIANNNVPVVPTPGVGGLAEESSHTDKDKVTTQVRGAHLPNRAEYKFEDVPLFIIKNKNHHGQPLHLVHSLYYLNWQLREASKAAYKRSNRVILSRKRADMEDDEENEIFYDAEKQVTIESVAKAIRYFGYQCAAMGNDDKRIGTSGISGLGRYRMFTTTLQGKVDYVPNIFQRQLAEKTTETLEEGDQVGFAIQRVPWKEYKTNWEGSATQITDKSYPETCVQVVPVAGIRGCIPLESGNENGSYDFRTIGTTQVEVNVPAVFIPVGRVIRISPQPVARDEKKAAFCQYLDYEALKTSMKTVDLYLNARYPQLWGV